MIGWSRGQKNEQHNNAPALKKNNAAAGYQSPVKIELLKGAGLLSRPPCSEIREMFCHNYHPKFKIIGYFSAFHILFTNFTNMPDWEKYEITE